MEGKAAEAQDVAIELEHAIGFKAVKGALFIHPNGKDYIYPAGATIVVADFNDPHNQVFLQGHDDDICCMAMSSEGNYIASGQNGVNADCVIWHYETKQLMYRFQEHDKGIVSVAFSDDEKLVCTVGLNEDNKILVWDMSTGYIVAVVGHNPAPTTICCFGGFVKDIKRRDTQNYLVATAGPKGLTLWSLDAYTGEMTGEKMAYEGRGSLAREFTWLQFGPDKGTVFCATTSGDFLLCDVRRGTLGRAVPACRLGAQHLVLCRQGMLVAGGDGTITLFDQNLVDVGQSRLAGPATAVCLAPDGGSALAGTAAGRLYRVPLDRLEHPVMLSSSPIGPVNAVAYSEESSERFATVSADSVIRLWDASDYSVICEATVKDAGQPRCLCLSEDLILTGWDDGRVRAHDADAGRALWLVENAHREGVSALLLSHNQRFLVSGGRDGAVRVWELRSRELVSHLKEHGARVAGLALYADDAHLLSCSRDRNLLCWDLRAEKRMTCHTQRMGGINGVALSGDETCVVTVGQEKRLTFWDLRDPNPVHIQDLSQELTDEAFCVTVSADGRFVATAGSDMTVKLWDMQKCNLLSIGTGHSGSINDLKFSPDDRQLVSVGEDGNIFVWNVYS